MTENANNEPQGCPDTQLSQDSSNSASEASCGSEATPRTPAPTDWVDIPFGKNKGKSLPQVALSDPDWIYWAYKNRIFKYPQDLTWQLADVLQKASRIILPPGRYPDSEVEYAYQDGSEKLESVRVVASSEVSYGAVYRSPFLNLFAASQAAPRDKMGGKIILRAFKKYVLGNENAVLRRELGEAFFSNSANFAL